MDKLITVSSRTIGGKPTPAVNARNLHQFLTIQSNYRDWIRNRISSYGFEKGIDYLCAKNLADSRATDHFVTLDMAKELAMVERNEKGRQARRYFIECEKQLKQQLTLPKPELHEVYS